MIPKSLKFINLLRFKCDFYIQVKTNTHLQSISRLQIQHSIVWQTIRKRFSKKLFKMLTLSFSHLTQKRSRSQPKSTQQFGLQVSIGMLNSQKSSRKQQIESHKVNLRRIGPRLNLCEKLSSTIVPPTSVSTRMLSIGVACLSTLSSHLAENIWTPIQINSGAIDMDKLKFMN